MDPKPVVSPLTRLRAHIMASAYKYEMVEKDISDPDEDSLNQKSRKWKEKSNWPLKVSVIVAVLIIVAMAIFIGWQRYKLHKDQVCTTSACVQSSALILAKLDQSVKPCDDFYKYACGGWEKSTFIPPDKPKYGALVQVGQQNQAILKQQLDKVGNVYKGRNSTAIRKLKTYFKTCMDKETVDKKGIDPVLKVIKYLGSWTVTSDEIFGVWNAEKWNLEDALVKCHKINNGALFMPVVTVDSKNSSRYILKVKQIGLTLASRDSYLKNDTEKLKKAYMEFGLAFGKLLGGNTVTVAKKMEAMYNFEKNLARIFVSKEDLQNEEKIYYLMTVEEFQRILGNQINVTTYLQKQFKENEHTALTGEILVHTPDYFKKLQKLLQNTSKEVLANYIVWSVIQYLPGYLPNNFVDAAMILLKAESGVTAVGPRWQRCIAKSVGALGFASGALFVEEKFSKESKKMAVNILKHVRKAFTSILQTVSWMDEKTRTKAIDKANAIEDMIGYPDFILDPVKLDEYYQKLVVRSGEMLLNYLEVLKFTREKNLAKLGTVPDKSEWDMTPSDVNAYFNQGTNQIVVPAGILQRPFFDPIFPISFNYGSIGMVVGHELTHGFDNLGRMYDRYGNLKNWWTNSSAQSFAKNAQCMVNQYSKYSYDGVQLDGNYALSENIADNGGLKSAFIAYKAQHDVSENSLPLPALEITMEQLFFVGFAQVWCSYYTPAYARQVTMTDSHSIAQFRVIGSLSNNPDFSKAFNCPSTSPMNPANKCTVW